MEGMWEDFFVYIFLFMEELIGMFVEWVLYQVGFDDVAYLQYIFGFMGDFKGVIIWYENVMVNVYGCMQIYIFNLK